MRIYFLNPCCEYFSPSSKFSSTPAALFCFNTLLILCSNCYYQNNKKHEQEMIMVTGYLPDFRVGGDVPDELHAADANSNTSCSKERVDLKNMIISQ